MDSRPGRATSGLLTISRHLLCAIVLLVVNNVQQSAEMVPLSFARKLRNVKSNEDFLRRIVYDETDNSQSLISKIRLSNSLLKTGSEPRIAEFDSCQPRDTPVEVPEDPNPRVFYWPLCVNVSRCGGCCGHNALTCSPVIRRLADFRVLKMIFNADGSPEWSGEVTVQLEAHTACDCECRVKPTDCDNRTQKFDVESCSCRCVNESGAATCRPPKHWDPQRCGCYCQKILYCLDDEYFNYGTCTCQRFVPTTVPSQPTTTPGPPPRPLTPPRPQRHRLLLPESVEEYLAEMRAQMDGP